MNSHALLNATSHKHTHTSITLKQNKTNTLQMAVTQRINNLIYLKFKAHKPMSVLNFSWVMFLNMMLTNYPQS